LINWFMWVVLIAACSQKTNRQELGINKYHFILLIFYFMLLARALSFAYGGWLK